MSEAINEDGFMVECDIADDDYSISTNLKNRSAFFIQTLNAFFEKIGSTSINMELVSQAIKRYQLYSDYLCANIATIEKISEHNDTDKTTALSIVSMILTGSLLEATIVFFFLHIWMSIRKIQNIIGY